MTLSEEEQKELEERARDYLRGAPKELLEAERFERLRAFCAGALSEMERRPLLREQRNDATTQRNEAMDLNAQLAEALKDAFGARRLTSIGREKLLFRAALLKSGAYERPERALFSSESEEFIEKVKSGAESAVVGPAVSVGEFMSIMRKLGEHFSREEKRELDREEEQQRER